MARFFTLKRKTYEKMFFAVEDCNCVKNKRFYLYIIWKFSKMYTWDF